jgi:predicted HD phosphohydrolase
VSALRSAAVSDVLSLFARHGDRRYGESVTQTSHACQAAALAVAGGADDAAVAAALLHDVGHLLRIDAGHDVDAVGPGHETLGARWLAARFGPVVATPVALHVQAKRYLCAVDTTYAASLSVASVTSLALQGGPLDAGAARRFAAGPWADAAVALRRRDDAAKDPAVVVGRDVPGVEDYTGMLEPLVIS